MNSLHLSVLNFMRYTRISRPGFSPLYALHKASSQLPRTYPNARNHGSSKQYHQCTTASLVLPRPNPYRNRGQVLSLSPFQSNKHTSTMALTPSTDPLVWVDCEMTGLDATTDTILSISCYITDHHLELLDPAGYHAMISTPKVSLDAMDEWCQRTHSANGLIDACLSSSAISAKQASSELVSYIKEYVPKPRTALLAGNSVHADKMFLVQEPWTPVVEYLHYRILDVSAIKEGVRRWCSEDVLKGVPQKKMTHSAAEDVEESIEEARYYMQLFQGIARPLAPRSVTREDWGSMD